MADEARHLVISGKVQGVGYRAFVLDQAKRLGLHGWVRNRGNGTVEALVSGEMHNVAQLIRACRAGPSHARVDGVAVTNADDGQANTSTDFMVLPDA